MRTWRIVTYISLVALVLCLALILSTPLRFPGYIILSPWPMLMFLVPAMVICALLIARLSLPHRTFSAIAFVSGLLFLVSSLANYMALVVLLGSLIALALLLVASRSIELSQHAHAAAEPEAMRPDHGHQ